MPALAKTETASGGEVIQFEEFFREFYSREFLESAREGRKAVSIDFSLLDKFDPNLADKLLNDPRNILEAAQLAVQGLDFPEENVKIVPRFKNLPEAAQVRIRDLRAQHIRKFIQVDGIVRRASEVLPEVSIAIFSCPDCGNKISIEQNEKYIKPPAYCDNDSCGYKGKFEQVSAKLIDSRRIVLEEPYETTTGSRSGEVTIYLIEDMTTPEMQRKTDPGNRLKITGIVTERRSIIKGSMKRQLDIFIEANHAESADIEWDEVTISDEDKKKILELAARPDVYDKLVGSLAPSIFGLKEVKEAILLQMFGGVQHILPDKTRIRGDIHILLLGDPSVAKSQLLKLTSSTIPRGKYASGGGVTGTGLTATVFKDEELGDWVLEAGALVLANKSLMAIDEFDKIDREDLSRLHEALEQQTISIAKASIVATLPAQVSVLAGANPTFGRFDPLKPMAEQTKIPETLLSRFDLKFALRDVPDRERDERLASHILETRLHPEKIEPEISTDLLRKYIAYARKFCKPQMTRDAVEMLKKFYLDMRAMSGGSGTIAITLRQNEALMRLSEASAKIRLGENVEVRDAERAIHIMKESLRQLALDAETGKIDIDRVEGITPGSQRQKIHNVIDIIERLSKQIGKQVPREEILAVAQDEGIKEDEADELLNRLKREGIIFEPKQGFVQKI